MNKRAVHSTLISAVCADVFLTCVAQALTTEAEETMGLLLGDVEVLCFLHTKCSALQTPFP